MCKVSSELLLGVEGNDMMFSFLRLLLGLFGGDFSLVLGLGGDDGLLSFGWFRVGLVFITGDIVPSVDG